MTDLPSEVTGQGASGEGTSGEGVAAPAVSSPEAGARAIFEHRDPVRTLTLQPQIVEVLSTIFDPEIPVNIYELGLVYEIAADARDAVAVRMTLTSPGCPAAQSLPVEVVNRLKQMPGVTDAQVEIVWDPPWNMNRMSDAAKLQLGLL
jgi:FeS assembly SUF system protein